MTKLHMSCWLFLYRYATTVDIVMLWCNILIPSSGFCCLLANNIYFICTSGFLIAIPVNTGVARKDNKLGGHCSSACARLAESECLNGQ